MNKLNASCEFNYSVQPRLNCSSNLQRFKGYYRLVGLSQRIDRYKQTYWVVQLSDIHQCFSAYYFSESNTLNELHEGDMLQCEISIKRHNKSRYLHLAYAEKASHELCIKKIGLQSLPYVVNDDKSLLPKFLSLVNSITSISLKNFIAEVLIPSRVCIPFLQAPASFTHHHDYPGGLLAHLIEVTNIVANIPWKQSHYRDIAITSALLNDIGSIKTLSSESDNFEFKLSNSTLTIDICTNALTNLEQLDKKSASLLRRIWTCTTSFSYIINTNGYALGYAMQIANKLCVEVNNGDLTT